MIIILSVVSTGLFIVWTQTRRELQHFEAKRLEAETELDKLREERELKEAYLRSFLGEPEFVERVIRERMGYVAPDEVVFRFENP
ncbi:MAG: septum formation initiator family protein [Oceanipulchritudo sp.]